MSTKKTPDALALRIKRSDEKQINEAKSTWHKNYYIDQYNQHARKYGYDEYRGK